MPGRGDAAPGVQVEHEPTAVHGGGGSPVNITPDTGQKKPS